MRCSLISSPTLLLILHSIPVIIQNVFCHKNTQMEINNWFLKLVKTTSAHAPCGQTVMRSADHVGVICRLKTGKNKRQTKEP